MRVVGACKAAFVFGHCVRAHLQLCEMGLAPARVRATLCVPDALDRTGRMCKRSCTLSTTAPRLLCPAPLPSAPTVRNPPNPRLPPSNSLRRRLCRAFLLRPVLSPTRRARSRCFPCLTRARLPGLDCRFACFNHGFAIVYAGSRITLTSQYSGQCPDCELRGTFNGAIHFAGDMYVEASNDQVRNPQPWT